MSKTPISDPIKFALWGKAGGRCEYRGCNRPLWKDDLTQYEFNSAYVAHIVADQPNGPRGDPVRSQQLCCDPTNLMLLCDPHHRLIDRGDVAGHPEDLLLRMKEEHEIRIELATEVAPDLQSEILIYGANVGGHPPTVSVRECADAMAPSRYPASTRGVALGWTNSAIEDRHAGYWSNEEAQLRAQFARQIAPRLADGSLRHVSVFAVAPQPLLMKLGHLLSDLVPTEVRQRRREPTTWKWADSAADTEYVIEEPTTISGGPTALLFSLSGTVTDDRIHAVLGSNVNIWRMTLKHPHNDFLQTRDHLVAFRREARRLLDRIKATHGPATLLHVFPAMPVSAAVEFGRIIQPKADLVMRVYDQQPARGFVAALNLNEPPTSN